MTMFSQYFWVGRDWDGVAYGAGLHVRLVGRVCGEAMGGDVGFELAFAFAAVGYL